MNRVRLGSGLVPSQDVLLSSLKDTFFFGDVTECDISRSAFLFGVIYPCPSWAHISLSLLELTHIFLGSP